jgi:class 3 adenylate cyclase/tetratricopeptide (TPR) repeat protein
VATCARCGHQAAVAFRFCPECGAPVDVAVAAREQRKVVTVVFCDVTGSTALGERLDPEPLRALLARYFDRMRSIVESHGGTVEKFICDAVIAVFGVPVLHEDDALRAVRAAVEMRDALPALGVEGRIGVTTGEVVAGTEERLATGDPVNIAARLEQAAQPGEVLIGAETYRLVRTAVTAEPVEPLALKGKAEPVEAYRLLSVSGDLRRLGGTAMVGRERQQRLLTEAFAAVESDGACHLFTVLGAAGVGKSRLVDEFLSSVDATVVRGRCLSYGAGITYWPAVEVIKQLGVMPDDPAAADAIASLLGESDRPTAPNDIAWAFRKTLEQAARDRPVVCVLDDLHWGEPALLDLVEHVADWSRGAPILLLCMARPELLDRRAGWAGGKMNASTVLLEPLSTGETDELIDRLLGAATLELDLRKQIAESAEGNPLFVEEMLELLRESGGRTVVVPPSIQALLAARLDQLDPAERALLERGAIEGRVFHRRGVEALAPEEHHAGERLMALVRRELVRPDRSLLHGDDAFRFRHLLIRDAAYESLPKAVRAALHERFAAWLGEHGRDLVELDEILGYHLEQACRYRSELGEAFSESLASDARRHLIDAGRRAAVRQDFAAAANLFERAALLVPPATVDLVLELDLISALFHAGRPVDAHQRAAASAERAAAAADERAAICLSIEHSIMGINVDPIGAVDRLRRSVDRGHAANADGSDALVGFVAHRGEAMLRHMVAQFDAVLAAAEQALSCAQRAGLSHHESHLQPFFGNARWLGSAPISELLRWLDDQEARGIRHASLRCQRAGATAMLGDVDASRAMLDELVADLRERGAVLGIPIVTNFRGEVELVAGDAADAAAHLEEACRIFREIGEQGWLSTTVAELGEARYRLGDLAEAEARAREAAELGAHDDAATQMLWRRLQAKILAGRGDHAAAADLAAEAVAIAETTDMLNSQADAYLDQAEVLTMADDALGARSALEEALSCYARKGNRVGQLQAQARLEALLAGEPAGS